MGRTSLFAVDKTRSWRWRGTGLETMAKVGEGDSRWIVEHREDGANVNNWHWSEKDITPWARKRLKKMLLNVGAKSSAGEVKVKSVTKMEGDATLYNRKGVLKSLFDFNVQGKWEGYTELRSDVTKGEFKFEIFDEEPDITITMDGTSSVEPKLKQLMDTTARKQMQEILKIFSQEVRAGGDADLGDSVQTNIGPDKVVTNTSVSISLSPRKTRFTDACYR